MICVCCNHSFLLCIDMYDYVHDLYKLYLWFSRSKAIVSHVPIAATKRFQVVLLFLDAV